MAYNVLSTIRHDGVEYKVGDTIHNITAEAAQELIALKVLGSNLEGQVKEVITEVEQMTNDAKTELTPEQQAAIDITQSQAEAEALKNAPAKPVTVGGTTPEQVAAEAAKVK
jgi:hypothetical protein